ncbi:MAG: LysM peptidoglycan-binding domain-containing protein [Chloroflexota bacterium]
MMILSACGRATAIPETSTVAPIPTEVIVQQLVEPLFRQATTTPSSTPSMTPSVTATRFTGMIPTQATATSETNSASDFTETTVPQVVFGQGVDYTIVQGDTLTTIANRYDVTVDDLLTANGMFQSQTLMVGQVLLIPIPTTVPSPAPTVDLSREGSYAISRIATAQAMLPPNSVNDLPYASFIDFPASVQQRVQAIFARGQMMGRNPNAFTRIGDSTIEAPHFFYRFDEEDYHLGEYDYLQRTIDHYAGSFGHDSVGVIRGLHTWSVFDPMWAPEICDAGEHLLACEFRLHNPSVIIIRLGTNDRGRPDTTAEYYENIVRYCIEQGVIPILGTKADRFDGEENPVNGIIRDIAEQYQVPLWDFDLIASTLPSNGLTHDNIHLSIFYAHDWREERGFTTGHGLHNLTGLIVLDELLQLLQAD